MAIGFRKSMKIGGVRVTASKSGLSAGVGKRGAGSVGINTKGQKSVSAGRGGFFWRRRK